MSYTGQANKRYNNYHSSTHMWQIQIVAEKESHVQFATSLYVKLELALGRQSRCDHVLGSCCPCIFLQLDAICIVTWMYKFTGGNRHIHSVVLNDISPVSSDRAITKWFN